MVHTVPPPLLGAAPSIRLNGEVVRKANVVGETRSQRDLDLHVHRNNQVVDVNRVFSTRDMCSASFWCQQKVAEAWQNIGGPPPGGNVIVPPDVSVVVCGGCWLPHECSMSHAHMTASFCCCLRSNSSSRPTIACSFHAPFGLPFRFRIVAVRGDAWIVNTSLTT